jgi:two-component system, chemotaxis family, chemotaxis protein CheY
MSGYQLDRIQTLCCDENQHMLFLIAEILRGLGIRQITMVRDSASALQELSMRPFDLIVTSMQLRPLDGIELTEFIRSSSDVGDNFVPIIMVTSQSFSATVAAARDIGVTEFLVKPISARNLYLRILETIDNARPFIRSQAYFGPDRRRRAEEFKGKERRKDSADNVRLYPPVSPVME